MQTTRRGLLAWSTLGALGWGAHSALGAVSVSPRKKPGPGETLVSIFLRGGADGLSLVVPYGDDDYTRSRPTLALAGPKDGRASVQDRAVDLDGFFGLHPALSPLLPLYRAGQMAVVPACGSGDQTRSHFEAMATMERGGFRDTGPASGWLTRHLQSAPWDNRSPLRAVALGGILPATLQGTTGATALESVADLRLQVPWAGRDAAIQQTLYELYGGRDALGLAGYEALGVLRTLQALTPAAMAPEHGAVYPHDGLGQGLHQVACLIKSNVGLEAACLDQNGYDTHIAQGRGQGTLADCLHSLGTALAAFAADLGPKRWSRTTVVVLSEFGRRIDENSVAGTDHGRGGVLFVLGGRGINGGKVHGTWPGLAPAQREGPGDVRVTTDYRNVLSEVIAHRLGNPNVESVFPGLAVQSVGVIPRAEPLG
jgi:uncharacterized protein (DUF1501 family)